MLAMNCSMRPIENQASWNWGPGAKSVELCARVVAEEASRVLSGIFSVHKRILYCDSIDDLVGALTLIVKRVRDFFERGKSHGKQF